MTENPKPPPNLEPMTPEQVRVYTLVGRDPVAFFLEGERRGRQLTLKVVFSMLKQFRLRVSLPQDNRGRLNVRKSAVDPDIQLFVEGTNSAERYYEGLFKIVRRLGFDITDCVTFLMEDVNLKTSTGNVTEWVKTMESAKKKVEGMGELPPVSRKNLRPPRVNS